MIQLETVLPAPITRLLRMHTPDELEREQKLRGLKHDLNVAKASLKIAMTNFDNVTDPKLVDMYIYRIQSAQTQYDHILQEIKKFG